MVSKQPAARKVEAPRSPSVRAFLDCVCEIVMQAASSQNEGDVKIARDDHKPEGKR